MHAFQKVAVEQDDIARAILLPTTSKELVAYCKTNMAPYKRPRWIEFIAELPKTPTGKIQRSALRYTTVVYSFTTELDVRNLPGEAPAQHFSAPAAVPPP